MSPIAWEEYRKKIEATQPAPATPASPTAAAEPEDLKPETRADGVMTTAVPEKGPKMTYREGRKVPQATPKPLWEGERGWTTEGRATHQQPLINWPWVSQSIRRLDARRRGVTPEAIRAAEDQGVDIRSLSPSDQESMLEMLARNAAAPERLVPFAAPVMDLMGLNPPEQRLAGQDPGNALVRGVDLGLQAVPFMGEFMAGGGAAKTAITGAGKLATKSGLRSIVAKAPSWAQATSKAVGRTAAGAAGMMPLQTLRVGAEAKQRLEFGDEDMDVGTAVVLAAGNVYIELLSEMVGANIFNPAARSFLGTKPGAAMAAPVRALMTKVGETWRRVAPNRTFEQFATKLLQPGGFDGVLSEIGEERVGDVLRWAAGVPDPNGEKQSLLEALVPPKEQWMTELVGFSLLPAGARAVDVVGTTFQEAVAGESDLRTGRFAALTAQLDPEVMSAKQVREVGALIRENTPEGREKAFDILRDLGGDVPAKTVEVKEGEVPEGIQTVEELEAGADAEELSPGTVEVQRGEPPSDAKTVSEMEAEGAANLQEGAVLPASETGSDSKTESEYQPTEEEVDLQRKVEQTRRRQAELQAVEGAVAGRAAEDAEVPPNTPEERRRAVSRLRMEGRRSEREARQVKAVESLNITPPRTLREAEERLEAAFNETPEEAKKVKTWSALIKARAKGLGMEVDDYVARTFGDITNDPDVGSDALYSKRKLPDMDDAAVEELTPLVSAAMKRMAGRMKDREENDLEASIYRNYEDPAIVEAVVRQLADTTLRGNALTAEIKRVVQEKEMRYFKRAYNGQPTNAADLTNKKNPPEATEAILDDGTRVQIPGASTTRGEKNYFPLPERPGTPARLARTLNRQRKDADKPSHKRVGAPGEWGWKGANHEFGTVREEDGFRLWFERNDRFSAEDNLKAKVWYETVRNTFESYYGEETGFAMMIAFLMANKNVSVPGGAHNAMLAKERAVRGVEIPQPYQEGDPRKKGTQTGDAQSGLAHKALWGWWTDSPTNEGLGTKLFDFIDSALGNETRSWFGHAKEAGAPAVIDVWAMRDLGFLDKEMVGYRGKDGEWVPGYLRELGATDKQIREAKKAAKAAAEKGDGLAETPSEQQYEWAADMYRKIAAEANRRAWLGRTDWKAHQIQAVGWMNMQRAVNRKAMYTADGIHANIRNASFSMGWNDKNRSLAKAVPGYADLPYEEQLEVGREWLAQVHQIAAEISGVTEWMPVHGSGGFGLRMLPPHSGRLLGSKEGLRLYASIVGLLTQQDSVVTFARNVNESNGSKVAVHIEIPAELADHPDKLMRLWRHLKEHAATKDLFPGFAPMRALVNADTGDLAERDSIVLISTAKLGKALEDGTRPGQEKVHAAISEVMAEIDPDGEFVVHYEAVDSDLVSNNWKESPDGEGYSQEVDRTAAPGTSDRLRNHHRRKLERELRKLVREAQGRVRAKQRDSGRRVARTEGPVHDRRGSPGSIPTAVGQLETVETFTPSDRFALDFSVAGVDAVSIHELDAQNDTSRQAFSSLLKRAKTSQKGNGWAVSQKSESELRGARLFVADDGKVGFAVQDGDIVAVFKHRKSEVRGWAFSAMSLGVQNGGLRCDCYGQILAELYAAAGMRPVGQTPFNEEFAAPGWTPEKGTPPIIFMVARDHLLRDGPYGKNAEVDLERIPVFEDYDAAVAEQIRQQKGIRLYSMRDAEARASVEFSEDGRAILRALHKPTIVDMVHELGHVFRRDLSEEDMATAAAWAGVGPDGVWTIAAEEKFADGFVRYLADGQAPTEELRGVFERFKAWILEVFRTIQGSRIDIELTPEIRDLYDRMLGGEGGLAETRGEPAVGGAVESGAGAQPGGLVAGRQPDAMGVAERGGGAVAQPDAGGDGAAAVADQGGLPAADEGVRSESVSADAPLEGDTRLPRARRLSTPELDRAIAEAAARPAVPRIRPRHASDGARQALTSVADTEPYVDIQVAPLQASEARPVPSKAQIFVDLAEVANVRPRYGKIRQENMPEAAMGAYYPANAVMRVRFRRDIGAFAHELAHALDDMFGIVARWNRPGTRGSDRFDRELMLYWAGGRATQFDDPTMDPDLRLYYQRAEGVAEWVRHWLMNPDAAIQQAPEFAAFFQQMIAPQALAKLRDAGDNVRVWLSANGLEQIKSGTQMVWESKKQKLVERYSYFRPRRRGEPWRVTAYDWLSSAFLDQMSVMKSVYTWAAEAKGLDTRVGRGDIAPSRDVRVLSRLFLGFHGKMDYVIEHGLPKVGSAENLTPGGVGWLLETMEDTDELKDLAAMMIAERVVGLRQWELLRHHQRIVEIQERNTARLDKAEDMARNIANRATQQAQGLVQRRRDQADRLLARETDRAERNLERRAERSAAAEERRSDEALKAAEQLVRQAVRAHDVMIATAMKYPAGEAKRLLNEGGEALDRALSVHWKKIAQAQNEADKLVDAARKKADRILERRANSQDRDRRREDDAAEADAARAIRAAQREADRLVEASLRDANRVLQRADRAAADVMSRYADKLEDLPEFEPTKWADLGGGVIDDFEVAQDALRVVEQWDQAKRDRFSEAAKRYRQWGEALLDVMVDSGRMTEKRRDEIKGAGIPWVSFMRVLESDYADEANVDAFEAATANLLTSDNPIKRLKGSWRDIADPYGNLLKLTAAVLREGDRNIINREFVDMLRGTAVMLGANDTPEGIRGLIWPASADEAGTLTIYREGEAEHYGIDPMLMDALKTLGVYQRPGGTLGQFYRVITAPSRLLRGGITNSVPFAIRNRFNDTFNRLVNSRAETFAGLKKQFREAREVDHDTLARLGGAHGGHYMRDAGSYYKAMEVALKQQMPGTMTLPERALQWFSGYKGWIESQEAANRIAEFQNSRATAINRGLNEYDAALLGAYESRDLMDFAVMGTVTQFLNDLRPFTNARIRGVTRHLRTIFGDAGSTPAQRLASTGVLAGRLLVLQAIPQLAMRVMLMATGDDEEYRQQPQYIRDLFWLIPNPTPIGPKFFRIPKGYDVAMYSSGFDRMIDAVWYDDPNAFDGIAGTVASTLMPIELNGLIPPAAFLQQYTAVATNQDMWRDRFIISPWEEGQELARRNVEGTAPGWAVAMQDYLDSLPGVDDQDWADARMIEHLIKTTFGTLGQQAVNFATATEQGDWGRFLVKDVIGLGVEEATWTARDVQWVFREAERRGRRRGDSDVDRIYFEIDRIRLIEDPDKREAAKSRLYQTASEIRERWSTINSFEKDAYELFRTYGSRWRVNARELMGAARDAGIPNLLPSLADWAGTDKAARLIAQADRRNEREIRELTE